MFAEVVAIVAFGMLLYAGVSHLLHTRRFLAAIRAQRVWSSALVVPAAAGAIFTELAIGAVGLLAAFTMLESLWTAAFLAATGIYAVYAVYATVVLRRRTSAPCGCSAGDEPISRVTAGRAVGLAILSVTGAMAGAPTDIGSPEALAYAFTVMAGVTIGAILWVLPAALHDPFADEPVVMWERVADEPPMALTVVGGADVA